MVEPDHMFPRCAAVVIEKSNTAPQIARRRSPAIRVAGRALFHRVIRHLVL